MKMMKKPMAKKMAVSKAQNGKKQKPTPTYKNLKMGAMNEYEQVTGSRRDVTPTSKDSARYRGGFEQGLKGMKGAPNEGNIEKMGRWEGQNVGKKKMQAGGVAGKQPKAGMVDPKGAYTKVQQRTLGNMKKGGVKKAPIGALLPLAMKVLPAVSGMMGGGKKQGTMKKGGKMTKKK